MISIHRGREQGSAIDRANPHVAEALGAENRAGGTCGAAGRLPCLGIVAGLALRRREHRLAAEPGGPLRRLDRAEDRPACPLPAVVAGAAETMRQRSEGGRQRKYERLGRNGGSRQWRDGVRTFHGGGECRGEDGGGRGGEARAALRLRLGRSVRARSGADRGGALGAGHRPGVRQGEAHAAGRRGVSRGTDRPRHLPRAGRARLSRRHPPRLRMRGRRLHRVWPRRARDRGGGLGLPLHDERAVEPRHVPHPRLRHRSAA